MSPEQVAFHWTPCSQKENMLLGIVVLHLLATVPDQQHVASKTAKIMLMHDAASITVVGG